MWCQQLAPLFVNLSQKGPQFAFAGSRFEIMSHLASLCLAFLLLAYQSVSAAVRCDLGVPGGATGACIDPSLLAGKTLKVPANVTRIGEGGLALCTPTTVQKLSSDIVYVVDNSASMAAWGFWIPAGTTDTVWYIPDCAGSQAADTSRKVAFRKRHFGGKTGADSLQWDTLVQMTGKTRPGVLDAGNCKEANDPYSMRAQAVRVALNHQAAFDSGSMAGVVFFNSKVTQKFPLDTLDRDGLASLQVQTGLYNSASGTLWAPPFDTAMRWLANSPVTGRSKAIILISDGEPSDDAKYTPLLGKDGQPPIYAIYLGQASDKTPKLDAVVALTLGQKFVVPPDRPDSLEGVIKAIVASVTVKSAPTASRLTNITNGQTSRSLGVTGDSLDAWRLGLDSAIGLSVGPNLLRWVNTWKTIEGIRNDTSVFTLDVSGPTAPLGTLPVAGSPFSAMCFEGSLLQFRDTTGRPVSSILEGMTPVGIVLTPSGSTSLPLRLSVTSRAGDRENLALSVLDSLAPGSWGREMPITVARLVPAVPGSQTLDVRAGTDTLASTWCHPRDGRDCAEASLVVNSFREATLRWVPGTVTGPAGALALQAILPGQPGNSVQVSIYRAGRLLVNKTLRRVSDSLFQDSVRFVQGSRVPTGDTLRLSNPPRTVPDSLYAVLVWGLSGDTLTDVATIVRPPLALRVEWTGSGPEVMVTLDGGNANSRGEFPVVLSASSRSQTVLLDSSLRETVNVTSLASTGKGASAWIVGRFIDPVFGDTVVDSAAVPVPRVYLQYTIRSAEGPRGSLELQADLPGVPGTTVRVNISRRGALVGTVTLTRQSDSTFSGALPFRQGPVRPGVDTVWLSSPNNRVPDTLSAWLVYPPTGDTLSDTGVVLRPALRLDLRPGTGTVVEVALQGGFSDALGKRMVTISVGSTQTVSVDSAGTGSVDVLAQLSQVGGVQAWVRGKFVDPVYGDSALDSVLVAVPARSIRFTSSTVEGPRGVVGIEVSDPWTTSDTRVVLVAHGGDSSLVRLVRTPSGLYAGEVAFAQTSVALGDTLRLGRPAAGRDSLYAVLPRQDALPTLVARTDILRPSLRLVLSPDGSRPQTVQVRLEGGSADSRGEAWVTLTGPNAIPRTSLLATGPLSWGGERDLAALLPESPDSVSLTGYFVDPVYGDTAWGRTRLASPWFPARIEVYPAYADPRAGDTVQVRVWDKDVDSTKVGTIDVRVGGNTLRLQETGPHTGIYEVRLPAGEIDRDWKRRAPRELWRVTLVYTDPDHPRDVVMADLDLRFTVPPPELDPREPVVKVPTGSKPSEPALEIVTSDDQGRFPPGIQGVELKIWERTTVLFYLYDNMGVFVDNWEGVLDPRDAENAAVYLMKWSGRDRNGNPTAPGVYLMRSVLIGSDGKPLGNVIVRLGRR